MTNQPVVSEPVSNDWWEGVVYACEYMSEIGLNTLETDLYAEAIAALNWERKEV